MNSDKNNADRRPLTASGLPTSTNINADSPSPITILPLILLFNTTRRGCTNAKKKNKRKEQLGIEIKNKHLDIFRYVFLPRAPPLASKKISLNLCLNANCTFIPPRHPLKRASHATPSMPCFFVIPVYSPKLSKAISAQFTIMTD